MYNFNEVVYRDRALKNATLSAPCQRLYVLLRRTNDNKVKFDLYKRYFNAGFELVVNTKYCKLIKYEPVLQKMLKKGIIKQIRRSGFGRCNTTVLVKV